MEPKLAALPERRSARERLLSAADELFYEGGIHTVGIDRVIERAGVAKASLYDCFGSKEALIQAYLQLRHEARKARIGAVLAQCHGPRERLLGVFDALGGLISQPNYRGCAFARAVAESRPGSGVKSACDDARSWMRDLFAGLSRDAGAGEPQALAEQLMLLYDGASVSAQMDGPGAAAAARAAAQHLLDAAVPPVTLRPERLRRNRAVPRAARAARVG
jgi:AcrR family transcriptional regulator